MTSTRLFGRRQRFGALRRPRRSVGPPAASAEASGFASATTAGSVMVKAVPLPGTLCTVTSPPIIWQKRRVMASPSPVPPNLRVVEASAWVKAWKSFSDLLGGHADAGVRHAKHDPVAASMFRRLASSVIVPSWVNLAALDSRLNRPWRTLVRSARITPKPGGHRCASALAFFSTSGLMVAATSSIIVATSKVSRNSSILPASILDISRMSLISASRCLPAALIFSRSRHEARPGAGRRLPRAASRSNPRMALSGVRSSWLMLARNRLLVRLAVSAASLALPPLPRRACVR